MTSPLPWIKVYGDLPTHRKSVTLAALLGEPRAWTHVVELWLWVSRHAPEGDLGKMPDAAIAAVAGWRGDAASFVSALRVAGFLDETRIHAWSEHNGAHLRKQAADKARNERKKSESVMTENVLTGDSPVTRENVTSVESREYREEKEQEKNLAPFSEKKVAGRGLEAWLPPADEPHIAAEGHRAVVAAAQMGITLTPARLEKPPRGRPPKDTPVIVEERNRWLAKARALVGLTPEESPEGKQLCVRFAQVRKVRGIDQMLRALEGLEGDPWASKLGLAPLLSDAVIEKGLARWNKGASGAHVSRYVHPVGNGESFDAILMGSK